MTLLLILFIALLWHNSMQARERCLEVALRACQEMNVHLLDDTIALTSLRLRRRRFDRLRIHRIYEFRMLTPQQTIQHGTIVLLGHQVESMLLDAEHQQTRDGSKQHTSR